MDIYSFNEGEIIIVSYLELNEKLKSQYHPVKTFKIENQKLIETPNLFPSFVHLRNIFQSEDKKKIYFMDHGLDRGEFLGEKLKSFNLESGKVKLENQREKKFYFAGANKKIDGKEYTIFLGPDFIDVEIDGKKDLRINQLLHQLNIKEGFLSATFFKGEGFEGIYLGTSEFSNIELSKDLIVKINETGDFKILEVIKKIPPKWGTVFIHKIDLDQDRYDDFIISQHDLGYNNFIVGKVLSSKNYLYEEVIRNKSKANQWISNIESLEDSFVLSLRGGSNNGPCETIILKRDTQMKIDECFLGFVLKDKILYSVSYKLEIKPFDLSTYLR